ncbi:hypothetical protein Tco_0205988, partial [Tanacetum coccineum]
MGLLDTAYDLSSCHGCLVKLGHEYAVSFLWICVLSQAMVFKFVKVLDMVYTSRMIQRIGCQNQRTFMNSLFGKLARLEEPPVDAITHANPRDSLLISEKGDREGAHNHGLAGVLKGGDGESSEDFRPRAYIVT